MDPVSQALKAVSQAELARRVGTTQGYISLLFRGKRSARMETMGKLAKALGVNVNDIYNHLERLRRRKPPTPDPGPVDPVGEAA